MHDRCSDCGPNRRELLQLSLGGALGLAMNRLAWAEDEEEDDTARRILGGGGASACIVLYMGGGMSQTDTFDPKPGHANAGPLGAVKTATKGMQLSELLPKLAERSSDLALIRSMATREGAHERARYLLHTGYAPSGTVRHPDVGALVAQGLHQPDLDLPAYVAVNGAAIGAGFLGVEFAPFLVADPTRPVANLTYSKEVDGERFERRRKLLTAIEKKFSKEHPGTETDAHTQVYMKADRMMHSPKVKAFDLSDESKTLREAYGQNRFGQGCLMARRLIQAGVKVVEVGLGGWDTHQDNFNANRRLCGVLDSGFATLLADLRDKGMLRRTIVLLTTEFGRTPGINANNGRDHFAVGWSSVLAGGPIQGGRVIGATSDDGMKITKRPVKAQDLMASVFHALGCDPSKVNETPNGRPVQAVDKAGRVISELFAT